MRVAGYVFLLGFAFSTALASDQRYIGGERYIARDGQWLLVDASGTEWEIAPGRLFIRLKQGISLESARTPLSSIGVDLDRRRTDLKGFYRFRYPPAANPVDVLASVVSHEDVDAAFLDTRVIFLGSPNDAYYSELWNLSEIRAEQGWMVTTGSSDVTIAIIDDGFEYDHEDLAANIWSNPNEIPDDHTDNDADSLWYDGGPLADDVVGWDFIDGDNDPYPSLTGGSDKHGTACAGMAAATRDNSVGVAGIAGGNSSERPRLALVRGDIYSDITDAVEYCWRKGFDVISMSWTNNDPYGNVHALLDSAYADGAVLVAASGDSPLPLVHPPARYSSVIAVGGVGAGGDTLDLSYGPEQELVAPTAKIGQGVDLWTTDNYSSFTSYNPEIYCSCPPESDRYVSYFNGTSAACPEVAAVAALIKSHWPSITNVEIRQRLQASAIDIGAPGWDVRFGYGRVDVYRALTDWGTIDEDVTWSPSDTHDGVRYVSGDLTIAAGATLTIMPGTIIRVASTDDLASGADTTRIEFNVEGELIAAGTQANPIIFESWDPQTTEDWVGFYFDSQSGGGTFDHCVIKRAEYAIESYVPLVVANTEIDSCRYAGVVSQAGGALIEGCAFAAPGSFGVFLTTDTTVVRNTMIDGAEGTALSVQASAAATVRGSSFINSDKGLYHSGSTSFVDIDSSCTFNGNAIGVHFYQTAWGSNLKNSTVSSNTNAGIVCDASHPVVRWNELRYNSTAISCTNVASPLIQENAIRNSTIGVMAGFDAEPNLGVYPATGGNTIAYSSGYHVQNYHVGYLLKAENNCWNMQLEDSTNCEPKAGKIYGSVDTDHATCCEVSQSMVVQTIPTPTPERTVVTGLTAIVPNPFNPQTTIHYGLAAAGNVEIRIYDVAGRFVRELVGGTKVAGNYKAVWEGTDRRGVPVASGIYFVKMVAGRESFTRKLVLLK